MGRGLAFFVRSWVASFGRTGGSRKVLFMDAKKAHLNPICQEDVYIQLPEEAEAGAGICGKLEFWMYGMRPAAQAWEECYSQKMEEVGFKRGIGNSVVFYHMGRDISVLVHGDDFVAVGEDEDVEWFRKVAVGWFEMKVRGRLGDSEDDDKMRCTDQEEPTAGADRQCF